MNRRHFIRQSSLISSAALLPGFLHAAGSFVNGNTKSVKHVILCIVGGGVHKNLVLNQEMGNLMPGLFSGEVSRLIPSSLSTAFKNKTSLEEFGSLFTQYRYEGSAASHKMALHTLLRGQYLSEDKLKDSSLSESPIFNQLAGNGQAVLISPDRYFFTDSSLAGPALFRHYIPTEEKTELQQLHAAHKIALSQCTFGSDMLSRYEDLQLAAGACEIIQAEEPDFTCVQFFGADEGHGSFSRYAENLAAVSLGIQSIWETVQQNENMRSDTVLIVIPDFGRNSVPNSLLDENGLPGYDHNTEDPQTRELFCLMAGPKHIVEAGSRSESYGNSSEIAGLICRLLSENQVA